jgi:hypothetical protein
MKNRFLSAALGLSLSAYFASASDVVINEIMYHPFHLASQAEDTGQEWIELLNRDTNAVNLHGWRLTKGVAFTFTNVTLPPGGYMVVAASRTNFLAKYAGVTNVVGDWEGRLSNTDDELRLLNEIGEEVDRVAYADSGEWAVRARLSSDAVGLRGWDWLAPHDGGGATLELINSSMPNEYGQNWSASTVNNGTPGVANSVVATNTAPFIRDVSHFPLVPRSTETVRVTARIRDEQTNGLVVTLNYRNASSSSPPSFSPLPMFDDGAHGDDLAGDGLYAATIPLHGNGTVVEFYVSATDSGARTRQWPAPARNAPDLGGGVLPPESGANAVYQVDDSAAYSGTQPFYRMIMIESERAFLASIAFNLRNSDAAANGTWVSVDANGTEEHHLTSYRRRGAGSRGSPTSNPLPNYRVSFASDDRWKGVTGINLNSQYTHAQVAGSVISALAGLQAEYQKPVQVRVNGVNLASSASPQFGSYAQQELPDGDYAQNHFPDDPNGNVYRGSSGGHTATLAYLGTNPNSYISAGYAKTANGAEYDWSDLINLTDVLNNTPDASYVAAMQARVNVQQWMTYFAVFTLLDSKETSLGIGQGDDYAMYRGLIDPRFQLLGHDFDTILGQGDTAGNINDSIFRATAVPAVNRFLTRQEFAPIYYRTLTNLIVTAFAPEQVSAALDQHLSSWVSAGVISSMKSFSAARNAGVLAQIPFAITITHTLPIQGGYPRTTVTSVALSGLANAVETRSVLVNGTPATWSAWQARWTGTASGLQPGINRVLVQSLDADGREFDRAYLDVWYDDGAVVDISQDIDDDTAWLAADGPFNITTSITVPAGYTLTIEPGTTIYIAPGASITVRGRLLAQGTEAEHIHIGRNPALAGNWGSFDFLNNTADNRLAYVDFDSGGGTSIGGHNAQIHVNNSVVSFDHCTWPGTPVVQYISFDNSSFIVQHCSFPTYPGPTGPEMLHGVNGIPFSGYGIFRDNYFGHTWGFNDTIDFTGGQRPGAILQIIGNVFDGASDDHLDLDSTDAWIEGNIFMHAHRDPTRTDNALDTASAISGGVDVLGQNPDWTIINNLFYDVDHVFLNKGNSTTIGNGGGRVAFLYNTVAHVARENSGSTAAEISVFNWSDDSVALPDPAIGSGLYAAHNIIFDAPVLQRFYNPANHTVVMENNIFPATWKNTTNEWNGSGRGNQYTDPRLNIGALAGTAVSNVTPAQLRQAFALRPGSPALGAALARNIGGWNPYGISIGGAPIGTNTSTSATLTVGPGGIFDFGTNAPQPFAWTAFKWKLDNGPWSAIIPITNTAPFTNLPTISLNNLSNGPHTVYVSGRNDVGYFQDDTFVYPTNALALLAPNATPTAFLPNRGQPTASRTWFVNTNFTRLVINEVLARNTTVLLDGKYSDYVELHNAGTTPVDLGGMSVSDDPLEPRKFVFIDGTQILPGQYLVLRAADGKVPGQNYLGFGLHDTGDGVYLYDTPAHGGALLDSVVFGLQLPDLSLGRQNLQNLQNSVNSVEAWSLCRPTPGLPNVAQPVGEQSRLRINEWLAAAGEIFQNDFIEIFNTDALPVPLGGLGLSISPLSAPFQNVIAPFSYIAGNGWQPFTADGDRSAGNDHVNFKLSAEGGWIGLTDTNGIRIDMIVYGTQVPDVSQGRTPDGNAFYVSFNQATPGAGNPASSVVVNAVTTTIVPLTQTWRMEASGSNLGTGWRATNYNDTAWPFSGAALFYNDTGGAPPPIPANSTIPFTTPRQITVYFRTTFNYSGPTNGVNFLLNHVIDDGCVVYLNNQEIYRFGFAASLTISYSSRPSTVSGTAPLSTGIPVIITNLVQGTNYLALELHSASDTSSDLAMALGIDSQQLVTNFLGTPIVLNEIFTKNDSYTNASGKVVDWVELYNPATNLVDISDLSLTDDPTRPRRWVFPQGATIAPGGYYVVEFDDSQPYSPFNAGFELSADSGAVYLFHRPTAGGSLLDSVVYGVQVTDLTLGRATPGANSSWTLGQPTRGAANVTVSLGSATALKINEWMANPPAGEEDWFELYNPGSQPVALGGLHLTDDTSTPLKHTIRPLSFIGAGPEAWLKFIADSDTSKGADHVGFRLANTEAIALYTTSAVPSQIDFISYTNAQSGVSRGRFPDGSTTNVVDFPDTPSPEEPNWLPLLNSVVINEALTRPTAPLEQAIELRNPGEVDVAIGGWFLSNSKKDLKRFLVPPGTLVSAGGFKVFYEAVFNPNHDVPPSFDLNTFKDDEIILSVADANGNLSGYRTRVKFGASAAGVSFGRHEKSTGDDFVAMSARTFGADAPANVAQFRTGAGLANAYPLVGPIVINEIQYHPPDGFGGTDDTFDEFIEILNASDSPVALYDPAHPTNSWRLRDGVDFDFPTNAIVPAWDYALVVSFNPATNALLTSIFRGRYGLATNVIILGPWIGKLDNSSDSVELLRPDAPVASGPDAGLVPYILVERVKYSDSAPWPSAADGNTNGMGISLQRLVALDYGNDPINWVAGVPTPAGETGPAENQPATINSAPGDLVVAAGSNVTMTVSAAGTAPLTYQWRFNGAVISGATNAVLFLPNVQPAKAGSYSVVVANKWGAAVGGPARLSVQAPPQISQQPQSRTVVAGVNTTFIVTASGGALQYQWRFNGTNIAGATNSALVLTNVQLADTGGYDVRVSNTLGATNSLVAALTVLVAPSVTTQPQSLTVIIGNTATFTAAASGTLPLGYQWRFGTVGIPGATNATLTITNVQPFHAGDFTLVVTNAAGAATSIVATLTVIVPPTVTVVASDAFAAEPGANTGTFTFSRTGSTASDLVVNFTVSGSADPGSDYFLRRGDEVAIGGYITISAGAVTTNIIVVPLDDSALEGDETVVLTPTSSTNYLVGGLSSATVVIHDEDNAPPAISILTPTNGQLFVATPTNVSFTVSASDPDGNVVKVEFFADGTNKLGESVSAPFDFTWTNASAGSNSLTARATDNLGSTAESVPVAVVLNAAPAVAIISPGGGASFTTPASIPVSVFAADSDGTVAQVEFFAGATLFATVTNAPFGATFNTAALGNYPLQVVATDNRGARATSAVVSVSVVSATIVLADAFANRPSVNGYAHMAIGNNTSATRETGEPPAYNSSTRTVWMEWTAPAGGVVTIDLCGSSFDTVLAVYTNTTAGVPPSVSTLTLVVRDDDGAPCGGANSRVSFTAGAGVAYQIRVEGYSSSSGSINLNLNIVVTTGPPILVAPPTDQFALIGATASFSVGVYGATPFYYQWRFFGTNVPGATNSVFTLSDVNTNMVGPYSVLVSNALGSVTSSPVALSVIETSSEYFRVIALVTNNSAALEHYQLTGYDPFSGQYGRGGIGVSGSQVIVNAGQQAARFSAANLSGGVALTNQYDALVTDFRTETIYCFGTNATGIASASQQATTLTHLLELNGVTGFRTGNAVPLSRPITLAGAYSNYGFFSGYGRVVVVVGTRVYHIALPSGAVADLGALPSTPQHNYAFIWGYWGLVESTESGLALVYGRDSQTITRTRVPSGATTNFATFSNLGYFNSSLSFSVTRSRWYFDHYADSQFANNGTEVVGFADAQFTLNAGSNLPPTVLVAPVAAQALQGGRASFAVSAVGGGLLGYQWLFNGLEISGALSPGLVVLDVQAAKEGSYSVVITNAFGAVTTAPVALTIALPPVITNQPPSQTVFAGDPATFTVGHSGDGPFTYLWKFAGSDAAFTTSNSLVAPAASFYMNGLWRVEVRNAVGVAISSNFTFVVLSRPFFNTQPFGRQVLSGMSPALVAAVDGSKPFYLQWRKDGIAVPGATNMTLTLSNAQPSDSAEYTLWATNIYGAVTSVVAAMSVVEPDVNSFAIRTLGTNNAVVANVFNTVGYPDYNGLAASASRVFLNGYGTSGTGPAYGYVASDLSPAASLGGTRNGLVCDLRSRKVYSLANGTTLLGTGGGTVNTLIELDGVSGGTTANVTTLSTNFSANGNSAIFSGYGRIIVVDGSNRGWDIALPSGQVKLLGTIPNFNVGYAFGSFAYRGWGIAEQIGTNIWLAHIRDQQTIERIRLPDGMTETIATFSDLGYYAGNMTVCLSLNRWYFNFGYTGNQFSPSLTHGLAGASAAFIYMFPTNTPPSFVEPLASVFAPKDSTVVFNGLAEGATPLRYQWFFQGSPIAGQTNATLTLPNARLPAEGAYHVVVSNHVAAITSLVATLTVNYGASTTNIIPLLGLTNTTWRFSQSAVFNTTNWIGSNFNDSAWTPGRALLAANEDRARIVPLIGTVLTLGRTTYYFRVYFNVPTNLPAGTMLQGTTWIDDGAVIYINGHELTRVRINSGINPVLYTTLANSTPGGMGDGDAYAETFFWLASTNLVVGSNVVAVEVHQQTAGSSDVVWGMSLDALVPALNRPPVITNHPISKVVSNGVSVSFTVGAKGTGPIVYQWKHEGTNLPGATGTTLLLTNVQRTHAGVYAALATNPYDTAFSSNATLVVIVPTAEILTAGTSFTAPGRFTLNFLGDPGTTFAVESSTNLIDWTEVGTVTNTAGSAQFDDNSAGDAPYKFYRLRLLP